jgi:hypothetical protein
LKDQRVQQPRQRKPAIRRETRFTKLLLFKKHFEALLKAGPSLGYCRTRQPTYFDTLRISLNAPNVLAQTCTLAFQ